MGVRFVVSSLKKHLLCGYAAPFSCLEFWHMELFRTWDLPVALFYKAGHTKFKCVNRSKFEIHCQMIIATLSLWCYLTFVKSKWVNCILFYMLDTILDWTSDESPLLMYRIHTHTHTHTHTFVFVNFGDFYTAQTVFSIALHLNLPLTGSFVHFYFLKTLILYDL